MANRRAFPVTKIRLAFTLLAITLAVVLARVLTSHDQPPPSTPEGNAVALPTSAPASGGNFAVSTGNGLHAPSNFVRPSKEALEKKSREGRARLKQELDEQHIIIIDRTYVPILESFGLPANAVGKIRDLIIDRQRAEVDAIELARSNRDGVRIEAEALKQATGEIDREITDLAGPEIAPKIRRMVQASITLGRLDVGLKETFAKAAAPLSPLQQYELAVAEHEVYSPSINPDAANAISLPIDPVTGLSKLDRQYLARLQHSLSAAQLTIARERMVQANVRANAMYGAHPATKNTD
jgi:hypothetical protein